MNIYEWQTAGGKNVIEEYFNKTTQYEQTEYKKTTLFYLEKEQRGGFMLHKTVPLPLQQKITMI